MLQISHSAPIFQEQDLYATDYEILNALPYQLCFAGAIIKQCMQEVQDDFSGYY
jgi:hypothetical protein